MFERIEQPKIIQEILSQIKQQIANHTLKKGDRLPSERALAEMFGVARATIREALKVLEMMGLIECVQGSGNYIANNMESSLTEPLSIMFMLEQGNLMQVLQLRRALETASVEIAAKNIDEQTLQKLEQLCIQLEGTSDESEKTANDRAFHYAISAASDNPLITTMLNAVSSLVENLITDARKLMLQEAHMSALINQQHRQVLNALKNKDARMAVAAMNAHMDAIERYLVP